MYMGKISLLNNKNRKGSLQPLVQFPTLYLKERKRYLTSRQSHEREDCFREQETAVPLGSHISALTIPGLWLSPCSYEAMVLPLASKNPFKYSYPDPFQGEDYANSV